MTARWLTVLLFLYVALDFSNPLMPGAVSFDADDSVEGVRAERPRIDDQDAIGVPTLPPRLIAPEPGHPLPSRWVSRRGRSHHRIFVPTLVHASPPERRSSLEDH
ncbi:MAG TPA: hypothetical protein VGV13_05140 [Methylomirabilota bacterium]|jgi:hypothetical protein|nr:hypothetical protein [Methylomirabilota bacterium]